MEKICVVGGGASGLFAAIIAKSDENQVAIFEKNEKIGKKLFITGKGRCNLTNAKIYDEFLDHIVTNKKFFYSSFTKFDNFATMDFFEEKGLKLDIQRGDRVFPKSEKSSDVIKVLQKELVKKKIDLKLNEAVKSLMKKDGKFLIETDKGSYTFDKVVLATGGLSYKLTGSSGDGYKFLGDFGHSLVDLRPALAPIRVKDKDINGFAGISLRNITLKVVTNKGDFEEFGDLLFANKMITGPVVLSMSSLINRLKVRKMSIDLKPALSLEQLDRRILRDFDQGLNLDIDNCLKKLLLNAFIPVILVRCGINPHKKVNEITRQERESLVKNIKDFTLTYDRIDDLDRAIITSGGVNLNEINPKTMESKLVPGLFVVGELLDMDAMTGGYNLQIARSTAYAAGDYIRRMDG